MKEHLVDEFLVSTRRDARDKARKLHMNEYGLHDAVVVERGSYRFTYLRESDGAKASILLVPSGQGEAPVWVVVRKDDTSPIYERVVIDFALKSQAAEYLAEELGGRPTYEVRPFLDVVGW